MGWAVLVCSRPPPILFHITYKALRPCCPSPSPSCVDRMGGNVQLRHTPVLPALPAAYRGLLALGLWGAGTLGPYIFLFSPTPFSFHAASLPVMGGGHHCSLLPRLVNTTLAMSPSGRQIHGQTGFPSTSTNQTDRPGSNSSIAPDGWLAG